MDDRKGEQVDASQQPAIVFLPSGRSCTVGQLEAEVISSAHWLIGLGMKPGDTLALMLENRLELIVLSRAARRAGLYFTPLSTHLQEREIEFMLRDCGASVLVVSSLSAHIALRVAMPSAMKIFSVDGDVHGLPRLTQPIWGHSSDAESFVPRPVGRDQLYSSGTTGMPRAIRKPMVAWESRHLNDGEVTAWRETFGFDEQSVYFSAAPLYHAAPLRYVMRTLDVGGRCVIQEKFEPEQALKALEKWGVTHSQWVPTMFVRMLALPDLVKAGVRLERMRVAIHSAAPCPVHVKQAMIDWWGPILYEYYAGTEGVGMTAIDSHEWLSRPGSVGKARVGEIRIVDDEGDVLPVGCIGQVFFAGGPRFEYLNDPVKTRSAIHAEGWATYGDIGHVDQDGYLYLSDRRTDLIISGGVNVYPKEVEEVLSTHPEVEDVAVIGVPDMDLGEVAKAVIQLRNPRLADEMRFELAAELIAYCRERMSHIKVPRSVNFETSLPRMENGKLMRRRLKERFLSEYKQIV